MKRIFGAWVLLVISCGASDANETSASDTSGDETAYAALDAPANVESTEDTARVESDATDTTTTDATTSTDATTDTTTTDATTSTTTSTDATTSTTTSTTTDSATDSATDATTSTTTDATTSTTSTTTTSTTTTDDSSCTRNADCPRGTRCLCVAGGHRGPDGNASCARRVCADPRHPPQLMP